METKGNHIIKESGHANYEQLVDFHHGLMDEESKTKIKSHLESCERCNAIYEGVKMLQDGKESEAPGFLEHVRQHQISALTNTRKSSLNASNRWKATLAIAASLTILVLLAWPLLSEDADSLVTAYIEEAHSPATIERSSATEITELNEALTLYNNGQFDQALILFIPIITKGGETGEVQFYAGLSHLLKKEPSAIEAISLFEKVLKGDSRYRQQARWLLSLAYYQSGAYNKTAELLRKISSDTSHFKYAQAAKLLDAL